MATNGKLAERLSSANRRTRRNRTRSEEFELRLNGMIRRKPLAQQILETGCEPAPLDGRRALNPAPLPIAPLQYYPANSKYKTSPVVEKQAPHRLRDNDTPLRGPALGRMDTRQGTCDVRVIAASPSSRPPSRTRGSWPPSSRSGWPPAGMASPCARSARTGSAPGTGVDRPPAAPCGPSASG